MRRADIQVGTAYLASSNNDWQTDPLAKVDRVLAIDTTEWVSTRSSHLPNTEHTLTLEDGTTIQGYARRPLPGQRGSNILVRQWDARAKDWQAYATVMRLQDIRAPYEEGVAIVNAARTAQQNRDRALVLEVNETRDRMERALDALGKDRNHVWGHVRANRYRDGRGAPEVSITIRGIEGLERIAEAYRKAYGEEENV